MSQPDTLDGVVVLVTGSTRGIGRATALALARQGAALAVCGRDRTQVVQLADEIRSDFAVPAFGRPLDVSDARAVDRFADECASELGPASVIINNAAILGPVGPLHRSDGGAWAAAVSINLVGVANVVRSFWSQLATSEGGRIVNLSGGGVGGPAAMQRSTAYVASKAGVMALTEALAPEAAAIGATVNAIAPGAIATGFMDEVLMAGQDEAGPDLFRDASGRVGREMGESITPYLALLGYILSKDSAALNGRTLSARWERPERLVRLLDEGLLSDSLYQLRRIDDDLFGAIR